MKRIILILLVCIGSLNLQAQTTNRSFFWGAAVSADLGRYVDRVELIPHIGFKIVPQLYMGLGASLSFYATESYYYNPADSTGSEEIIKDKVLYLGGELFLRYVPFENSDKSVRNIFLQTSYEVLYGNGTYTEQTGDYKYNTLNYTPFIGIGYKQPLSDRFSLGLLMSFKLNNEADSPYRNPIIRIAFEF